MLPTDPLARFAKAQDGTVAVIVALMLTVLLGFVAIGVDMAALYRERAQLQAVGDLTALSAMALPDDATTRAAYVIGRNAKPGQKLDGLETGRYLRNPDIAATNRFMVPPVGTPGINAVRVKLKDDAPLYFAKVISKATFVTLDRTAVATRTGAASFSLDSHLADLNGTNLNQALKLRFGASASLSAVQIDALADATIDLGALLDALAMQTGNTSRNPADILNATTTDAVIIRALQSLLPPFVGNSLTGLTTGGVNTSFEVASLVGGIDTDLGLTASEFASQIRLSGLDVVKALIAADRSGTSFALSAALAVPGVLSVNTTISGGEPPAQSGWIALGEEGVQLHRAAVRIKSDVSVEPTLLGSLGVGVTAAKLNIPLHAELAGATATLDKLNCSLPTAQSVAAVFSTASTPLNPANGTSVGALYLGTLPQGASGKTPINPDDLAFADLVEINIVVKVPLLPDLKIAGITIQGRSHVTVGESRIRTLSFTKADIASGQNTKTFGSGNLLSTAVGDLLSSQNLQLRVKPGQAGLVSGLAAPIVAGVLQLLPGQLLAALVTPVDNILDSTLDALGLALGEGELTLIGHHCEPIRLVQ